MDLYLNAIWCLAKAGKSTMDSYFGMGTAQIVAGEEHMLSQRVVQEFIHSTLRVGKSEG
jgi:hypothetical protein